MNRLRNAAVWLLILQLALGALAPHAMQVSANPMNDEDATPAHGGGEAAPPQDDASKPEGLRFRLSEGAEESGRQQQPAAASSVAPATKLSETETSKVLQRLPPLKVQDSDAQDFALREKSLPPPRTGQTVLAAFPAPPERVAPEAVVAAGPFEVVRYSPTGEVPLAPQLSVTFSQPMVAVTSQEEAAREVPVRLSPQVPGRWRWLGTKTLIFDPAAERLPMATEFTVSVPASARSANGGALKAPAAWKFATPPPQLKAKYPEGGPVRRDAVMFVEFDQRVDASAVLRTVSGGRRDCDGAARSLRRRRHGGPRHAFRRGAARDDEGADVHVPHLRPSARHGAQVRLAEAVLAVRPVADHFQQPDRPRGVSKFAGPLHAGAARRQNPNLWRHDVRAGRQARAHAL
ncbi:MAG: Ig-like domain-containing protein [Acidobacteria bacterium]|nr:Ig-like domain-containing protein [Acidobacteriota bacterium]